MCTTSGCHSNSMCARAGLLRSMLLEHTTQNSTENLTVMCENSSSCAFQKNICLGNISIHLSCQQLYEKVVVLAPCTQELLKRHANIGFSLGT